MAGKLTKMQILGFKKSDFKAMIGGKDDSTFTMQVNPEKYALTYKTPCGEPDMKANNEEQDRARKPDLKSLDLNFFLDSTGVVPGCKDVPKALKKFHKICSEVNGETHNTNFLKIIWGKGLAFKCRLTSVKVDYLMFNPSGIPIRAELNASFKEHNVNDGKKNSSPDMTHIRTIRAGDNLPALCHEIYDDPSVYIQVAEYNSILNFRKLIPGQEIHFPMMEK